MLSKELQVISRKLDEVLADERVVAIESDRRLAEGQAAIERLLQAVQESKAADRWRNTRFNLFEVLGCRRREQVHSSFLAWLLDPTEAHGLGDSFLRQLMRTAIGTEPPSTAEVTVSPEFECGDNRFDIHVTGDGWCLIVENKIDDSPWAEQCARYQAYCDGWKNRGQEAWLVYITPHARRPSKTIPHWVPYRDVRRLLESLTPSAAARLLIEQFCEHIFADLEVRECPGNSLSPRV